MKPLDSGFPGVIAPETDTTAAAEHAAAEQAVTTEPPTSTAIQDLPLPQLPEDLPPIEPPEFVLARKISEDTPATGTVPAGLPGLSAAGTPDPQDILSGAATGAAALLGDAHEALDQAAAPVIDAAQGVLGHAQNEVGPALGAAPAATATAAGPAAAAAAPTLPDDPVGALLSGAGLAALPGVDALFKPILDLLSSFGTGVIGALDPTAILSQSSKIIEAAMQVGRGSMATVDQLWQSQAARNAQIAGQEANNTGLETSQRGIDISELTQRAAAVVQQGNAQLTRIASSFATQAAALAPVIMTPPAQTALIASATQHLGEAVGVVNVTRGDLAGKTAELNGVVHQLLGSGAGPQPAEVAQAVAQNIGQPMLSQAEDAATTVAGLESPLSTGTPSTTAAGLNTPGTPGSPSFGAPGSPGSPSIPGLPSAPATPGVPGLPGTPMPGGMRPGLPGMPGALNTTPAGTSTGFMGSPAAAGAGQRNNEEEHSRNVESYQSVIGNDDLTGPLGESTPEVIGATHTDESDGFDYNQDQF